MANIIRCKLPNGIHRFKPFKVSDYRDFLLVRNDMTNKSDEEQSTLVNELAEDYFHEFPKAWQQYIFLHVFTGSIGKTKIPVTYECPKCGKSHRRFFNIALDDLIDPSINLENDTTINFKFPEKIYSDSANLVIDSIKSVDYKGNNYNWNDLTNESKENIISLIDFEKFEYAVKKLKPIHLEMDLSCCEKTTVVYDDLCSIFKLVINPDEVFPFYEINHILIKNKYDWGSIMDMLPAERTIALALIEKDNKK